MNKTAVIYARYSSDAQSEQSIEGQLRVCEEYARKNNILILETYIDRAMTGTNDNRPDFQRMIKDSSKRLFDTVLVYKLDRFSRNKFEATIHKKTLKDNGVKVISAMENIPDTPEGIILESLLEGMNQYFSAELAQKVARGMKETRRKGLYQGGKVLFGYRVEDRKLVINESEAEIVRYIYREYSKGVYVKDIIKALHDMGLTMRGQRFITNSVYNILRCERYSGTYHFKDEIIDNMYPRIIPDELFQKVRAIVDDNKYGKSSVKVEYLLSGRLFCGYCGQAIHGESGTSKDGSKVYYYKCNGRKKRVNDCTKSVIRKEELEQLVIENITAVMSDKGNIDNIVADLLKLQDDVIKANSSLNIFLKEQKSVETSVNNIVANMERGIVSKATTKRLAELEQRQEELERLILIERSKTQVKITAEQIREFYEYGLTLENKMMIEYFVRRIELYDDSMKIFYNNPLTFSPDYENGQGVSFYTTNIKINYHIHCKRSDTTIKIKVSMHI